MAIDYSNDPDFNKARTSEESTKEFADARAAVFAKANGDFNVGLIYGLALIPATLAILIWIF